MSDRDHSDDKIRDLFRSARATDRAEAPVFSTVRPSGRERQGPRPGFVWAAGLALAALASALIFIPALHQRTPEPVRSRPAVLESAAPEPSLTADLGVESQMELLPESGHVDAQEVDPVVPMDEPSVQPASDLDRRTPDDLLATAELDVPADTPQGLTDPVEVADASATPTQRELKAPPIPTPPPATMTRAAERQALQQIEKQAAVPQLRSTLGFYSPTGGGSRSGGLSVFVANDDGLPLPGAMVVLAQQDGLVKTTAALTDKNGNVQFPILRPAEGYSVQVSFPGLSSLREGPLRVKGGSRLTVPIQMIEEMQERVKVVAMRDVIEIEKSQSATRFSENFIADLPVPGRFYQNVLTMARGVPNPDGSAHVYGPRSRNFKAVVGGVSVVDPSTGESVSRFNTEGYAPIEENPFRSVHDHPLSTFSVDVDTASYANVRRFVNNGKLPPANAVRIEELINYFDYDYPPPSGNAPFSTDVEIADCPWNPGHRLARIGLKGRETAPGEHAGSNLVFLIDVSGSMSSPSKLPLLKKAFAMLVDQLGSRDQVAIVVYAGASGLVLPSTSGEQKDVIHDAVDRLESGGGTNGGAGLQLAYRVARDNYITGGVNRVILATDGDFNIGTTGKGELLASIKADARNGIFLTALGFGMGNLKDDMLELLADKGNGNYAYIDSAKEARKVLVEEISGTLITIAKDVKMQVEFNPAEVAAYRLIGYENRLLANEDFNDDRKDAGEIGSGHTVTALYELVPPGVEMPSPSVDALKYQTTPRTTDAASAGEIFTLKLRYKDPEAHTSRLLEFPVVDDGHSLGTASDDFKFASAVALFGMVLRDSQHRVGADLDLVRTLATESLGPDPHGHRADFRQLLDDTLRLTD